MHDFHAGRAYHALCGPKGSRCTAGEGGTCKYLMVDGSLPIDLYIDIYLKVCAGVLTQRQGRAVFLAHPVPLWHPQTRLATGGGRSSPGAPLSTVPLFRPFPSSIDVGACTLWRVFPRRL